MKFYVNESGRVMEDGAVRGVTLRPVGFDPATAEVMGPHADGFITLTEVRGDLAKGLVRGACFEVVLKPCEMPAQPGEKKA